MCALRTHFLLPALFVLAFCLRTPLLGLPLEGDAARLASVAAHWAARGGPGEAVDAAPLLPALCAPAIAAGVPPTAALRWADAFCSALLAPLLALLALSLAMRPTTAAMLGLLLAVHPLALAGGGGIDPGSGSLAAVLVLGALASLGAARGPRRFGFVAALLLCAADPMGLLLAPGLLWLHARREPSPRVQTALLMVAAALVLAAPLTWWRWTAPQRLGVGPALAWTAAASLGLLLPTLPAGAVALVRAGGVQRVLLATGAVGLLLALAGAAGARPLALALLLLVGVRGFVSARPTWRRLALPTAAACSLLASMWLVSGGLQAALSPRKPGAAGRMHLLREAVHGAARAAGARGWIVLAVRGQGPEEQASLADLVPDHWAWVERAPDGPGALRPLRVFPAAALESGRSVAVVASADRRGGIHTFDGAGIYHEEVLQEVGPYVVLRARRP